jgi:hypothetical protein
MYPIDAPPRKVQEGKCSMSQKVEIDAGELAELRKLQSAQASRKETSKARSKARSEILKKYDGEYKALVERYGKAG